MEIKACDFSRSFQVKNEEPRKDLQAKVSHNLSSKISPIYSSEKFDKEEKQVYEPVDLFSDAMTTSAHCLFASKLSEL